MLDVTTPLRYGGFMKIYPKSNSPRVALNYRRSNFWSAESPVTLGWRLLEIKESDKLYYIVFEIEYCHPLHMRQWALGCYGILLHKQGLHILFCAVNTHCSLIAENTVPTEYVNICTGKIENSLLYYLSDRKIVFKNTLLNVWVCIKVEFVCTVRQYFH